MKIPLTTVEMLKATALDSPCPVSWDAMHGDAKVRYCGQCQKHVHDICEMSAEEAAQLIGEQSGQVCVQLYRRKDGTLLTADGPIGVREWIWRRLRRRMAWAAALFAVIFLPGCPGGGNLRQPDIKDMKLAVSPDANQKAEERNEPTPIADPNSR